MLNVSSSSPLSAITRSSAWSTVAPGSCLCRWQACSARFRSILASRSPSPVSVAGFRCCPTGAIRRSGRAFPSGPGRLAGGGRLPAQPGDAPGIGDEHAGERPEVPNADMGACRWQSPAGQGGLDQLHGDAAQGGSSGPDDLPSIEAANIRDAAFGDDRVLTGQQRLVEAAGVSKPLVVTLAEVGGVLDMGNRALIGNRPEPPRPG